MRFAREVDEPDLVAGNRHVKLEVLPMPSDPTVVAGLVKMDDERPDLPGSHRSGHPMEIEVARSLAHKIARDRNADLVLIVDPKGLYPRHRRVGRMRTFPVLVMPGGRLSEDLRIDAVSPEVAAQVACGDGLLLTERGSMANLACEVFDGTKKIAFYKPPGADHLN